MMVISLKMMVESSTPSDGGLYNYSLLLSATIGIISSACCFYFVLKKLKINHIIKKLLLFASIQQCLGYGILFSSMMLFIFKIKNKVTCTLAFVSFGETAIGTQSVITIISLIR